ncbi:hypothetical protein INS49_001819 [Diaporthe citri]|uniref:uncharacterized protein n=1 Tax=Diaporthe citri TaxID=83186 RepID=UPI001C82288D|nr:uncharacterized protein INS49_001819 [Diaporthe citri]KAG6367626.1 hypothetical protein INS49_001819 [Diaporthe citri]
MPNDVNTAPRLPNGSHEHATDAPDRRGDSNTVSVQSQQIQSTLGDNQSFAGKSRGNDGIPIEDSPRDHHEFVDVTPEVDETLSSRTLVAVGPLDIAPDSFHFSNPSELALRMPYPTTIIEDTLSLCYHPIHSDHRLRTCVAE